ncbi:hypothetical protein F5883DRAFT_646977 [Diaporthe sp. PMI_573]|nr:hypothetical protein F5883DRAFT_646977 [Diaporthaceae sp. PMI_573]
MNLKLSPSEYVYPLDRVRRNQELGDFFDNELRCCFVGVVTAGASQGCDCCDEDVPEPLFAPFMGISAGANLAWAATYIALDRGLPGLCGLVAIYPMLDPDTRWDKHEGATQQG